MTSPRFDRSPSIVRRLRTSRWRFVGITLLLACFACWSTPSILKWQARRSLAQRDFGLTAVILDRLDRWFGQDGASCFLRARLCRKRGDWNGVRESLIRARDRKYPRDLLEREQWMTLAQSGQLRAAEPHLSKLLTDPRDDGAEICEAFVNGYFINYRMVDAVRMLDAWIADYPKDPEPRMIRAKIRVDQQFLKDAEADLRVACSLDPKSDLAALDLADVLILERLIEEAVKIYARVSRRGEYVVRAGIGQAKGLRLLNRPVDACTAARRVLESDPNNREALLEMGLAELDLGRHHEAIAVLSRALVQNPRSLIARDAMSRALRATGDLHGAREHSSYIAEASRALSRADHLAEQVASRPDDAQTRFEIGSIYLRYAVPDRGVQWLKSALDCDPKHQAARQALDEYFANRSPSMTIDLPPSTPATRPGEPETVNWKLESHVTAIRFRERKPDPDSDFTYQCGEEANRSTILEGMGGGTTVFDFDRDDRLDLFFPGGGTFRGERSLSPASAALFRNLGNWKYQRCEVAARANSASHYSHGVAVGDYDGDGFADLLVTGYGGVQLFRNQGDGTFLDSTVDSQLDDRLWSTSAAWGDLDGDGHLDLYLAHYVDWSFDHDPFCPTSDGKKRERCPPQQFGPLPDSLYLSQADGTFENASVERGLRQDGKGLGVVLADLDLDGDLDVYVANDTVGNFLYRNDGHGYFDEVAVAAGAAFNDTGTPDGSMGVAIADVNLDCLPDIWVVNYERETIALYRNLGHLNFEHVSQSMGVSSIGTMYVGFGTVFLDADLDGDEDVFVANGHVLRFPNNAPVKQLPLLFENLAGKRFVNVAPQLGGYWTTPQIGRGVAKGDLDDDGDVDVAVSHLNMPVSLLENTTTSGGDWLKVQLIGVLSNRDAIGARLTLNTSRGSQVRQISSGDSYLSQSDRTVHWGVPKGTIIESLSIDWPNGKISKTKNPRANRAVKIKEPID